MKPGISVVINTLNEEKNLPYALRSVCDWVDEIIVVDMYSDDKTVEIAHQYGAKIYYHQRILAFDAARQFAIDQAGNEWVLLLDADELIPQRLSLHLKNVAEENSTDVVYIPRQNFLLGAPLQGTGWGPDQDRQLRFFRRHAVVLSSRIHQYIAPQPETRITTIEYEPGLAIAHFAYTDATHFIQKLNIYTSIEAQQAFERGEHATYGAALYHSLEELITRYLIKKGYRDGWRGFYLSGIMAFYRWTVCAKLRELYSSKAEGKSLDIYQEIAETIIDRHKEINNCADFQHTIGDQR